MGQSVIGSYAMGLMGMPLVGSDICGFMGNTNAELCARWYTVAAFQTFSRNHNGWDSIAQEPYLWKHDYYESGITYTNIIKSAMRTKYCLLKYMYTEMFLLSQQGGSPFYKPVFFEFPDDINAYADQTNNVMLGRALKLSVLSNALGQNTTDYYFPEGTWCDVFRPIRKCFTTTGHSKTLSSKAYDFHLHLRNGYIVPL